MIVGIVSCELHLPESRSLKDKRRVVKSLVPAGIMAIFGWYGLHSLMAQSPVMSMVGVCTLPTSDSGDLFR